MLDLLGAAKSSAGTVNAAELQDLTAIVDAVPGTGFVMTDYVRNVSRKVLKGDPANAVYHGDSVNAQLLGNLQASDPEAKVDKLLSKWFYGTDHPAARTFDMTGDFKYQWAAGKLFVDGPGQKDATQNGLGDCYLIATLASVARTRPAAITNMFVVNGDGTYGVRFFKPDGSAEFVTVDSRLPVDGDGNLVFAGPGVQASDPAVELWASLAEKAYAQANESGWLGQDGTNSYNGSGSATLPADGQNVSGINNGIAADALHQIAGAATATLGFNDLFGDRDALIAAVTAGRPAVLATKHDPIFGPANPNGEPRIVGDHAYSLTGFDPVTQKFALYNPQGQGSVVHLNWAELQGNFDSWDELAA